MIVLQPEEWTTITNSTFINNVAGVYGGGIMIDNNFAPFQNSTVIQFCTFNNNTANYGGGIHFYMPKAMSRISSCTFVKNYGMQVLSFLPLLL